MFRSGNTLPEWFLTSLNIPAQHGYTLTDVDVETVGGGPGAGLKAQASYEHTTTGETLEKTFVANARQIEKLVKLLHIPKGCTSLKLHIESGEMVTTTVTSYLALPDTTSFNRSLIWALGEENAT